MPFYLRHAAEGDWEDFKLEDLLVFMIITWWDVGFYSRSSFLELCQGIKKRISQRNFYETKYWKENFNKTTGMPLD